MEHGDTPNNAGRSAAWQPPESLCELTDGDASLVLELIEAFTADTDARLHRLRDFLHSGDIPRLGAEAHSIKGSARQMGAEAVASLCQEIEAAAHTRQVAALGDQVSRLEQEVGEISRQMMEFSTGQ